MSTNEVLRAPARIDSADPRAARVRDRLRRAAFGLIEERRVEKISVSDITERAGVSRQVFYQHFRDRDDAVASAVAASLQEKTAAVEPAGEQPMVLIHRLCDFAAEHAELYRNLYPSAASQQTADAFRELIRPACERLAAGLLERPGGAALASFLIGGIIEVTRQQDGNSGAGRAADLRARIDGCLEAVGIRVG